MGRRDKKKLETNWQADLRSLRTYFSATLLVNLVYISSVSFRPMDNVDQLIENHASFFYPRVTVKLLSSIKPLNIGFRRSIYRFLNFHCNDPESENGFLLHRMFYIMTPSHRYMEIQTILMCNFIMFPAQKAISTVQPISMNEESNSLRVVYQIHRTRGEVFSIRTHFRAILK